MSDYPGLDLWGLTDRIYTTGEIAYIPLEIIENAFGPLIWEQFTQWMRGQTMIAEGVYPWDIERFLQGLPIID